MRSLWASCPRMLLCHERPAGVAPRNEASSSGVYPARSCKGWEYGNPARWDMLTPLAFAKFGVSIGDFTTMARS